MQLLLGCGKPEALLPRSGLSHIAEADYRELLRAVGSPLDDGPLAILEWPSLLG